MQKNTITKKFLKSYSLVQNKNPTSKTIIENKFGILEIICNSITPPIAFFLNRLNISADFITLTSFCFIGIGSFFFVIGNYLFGSISWLIFGFLDSLDGDLARLKKKTLYGTTLDSFGADIFYFCFPFAIGFYLFIYSNFNIIFFTSFDIIVLSLITSFGFTAYRIIGSKRYILFLKEKKLQKKKLDKKFLYLKNIYKKIDHEAIRINFFGEPGIILNCLIIALIDQEVFYFYYLIIISIYAVLRLIKSIIATYYSFKKMSKI